MTEPLHYLDIPMARISVATDGTVEVRIRPEVRIDVPGLLGSMQARRTLIGSGKGPIIFLAMGELDWEPAALQTDFFGQDQDNITAVAVAVNSRVLTLVANMYFGLFPARFPTKVFSGEADARTWLAALV